MVVPLFKGTTGYWIVHWKWVSSMVYKIYLNKIVKQSAPKPTDEMSTFINGFKIQVHFQQIRAHLLSASVGFLFYAVILNLGLALKSLGKFKKKMLTPKILMSFVWCVPWAGILKNSLGNSSAQPRLRTATIEQFP